ncbi:hypothetical protein JWG41_07310 [Leptospira sp. 201903075]|uniref:hypothetical protein n=1 Tax=Leptospira chreensis TaxID=2810035 RepID=UPI001966CD48|nr:hypothetical protein [Leptospira chreensis]MBM9590247.1 hypothetical protein [Leptospira chreensis]
MQIKSFKFIFSVIVSLAILLLPIYFQLKYSLDAEVLNNDYADLHLGHALSLDFWIRGYNEDRSGYFAITHPGLLFQIFSWLIYFFVNIATWFHTNGIDLAASTLTNSFIFFLMSSVTSSVLLCFCLFWTAFRLKFFHLIPLIGILYGITGEYTHTFIHFTNDYFAIPLILIWALVWKNVKNPLNSIQFYLNLGLLSSLVYLNKLPYIVWILSFFVTLVCFGIVQRKLIILGGVIVYTLTFLLATFVLSTIFFGSEGFLHMVSSHKALFSNSGRMGAGSHTFIDFSTLVSNFKYFLSTNNIFSTITIFLLVLFILYTAVFKKLFDGYSFKAVLLKLDPLVVWAIIAFFGGFLATLKHYGYNYLLVALSPLLLASFIVYTKRYYSIYLFFMVITLFSVIFNVAFNERFFKFNSIESQNLKETYKELSTDPSIIFITEYRNPTKQFTTFHTLFCSDLPQKEIIYSKIFPNSYVYYFEDPKFFSGPQKLIKEELKWDYWVSVYKADGLDWYSLDRFNYLSENTEFITKPSRKSISIFKRTR